MTMPEIVRINLPATHKYLNVVGTCIQDMLGRTDGVPNAEQTIYNLQLAVHECCANIVDHAYSGGDGRIEAVLTLADSPPRLVVELRDTGRSFDPDASPSPDLGNIQVRGYGLYLMRELLDDVDYIPQPGDNRWRLVKLL